MSKVLFTDVFGETHELIPHFATYQPRKDTHYAPKMALQFSVKSGDFYEPYGTLTVNLPGTLPFHNYAFVDCNNWHNVDQLLKYNFCEDTGLRQISGYVIYPVWKFSREWLREIGGEKYREYWLDWLRWKHEIEHKEDT